MEQAQLERSGPDAIGVTQPAPYRHFVDREALLTAVATEGFCAFIAALKASTAEPSEQSALRRVAEAYIAFGLNQNGLYRLMFASGTTPNSPVGSELYLLGQESFGLLVDAVGAKIPPAERNRRAVKVWVALHGTVMLAKQGLLRRGATASLLEQLIEDIIA